MAPLSLVMAHDLYVAHTCAAVLPVPRWMVCGGVRTPQGEQRDKGSVKTKASESRERSAWGPHQHLETLEWQFLVPLWGLSSAVGVWLRTHWPCITFCRI